MTARRGPIVVGVDGSAHAEGALQWATGLATELGVEVVAVHALGLLSHLQGRQEPAQLHRRDVQELLADDWTAVLRSAGVDHHVEVADGNPVTALSAAAAAHGASMVVVGSRGSGGFPGLQLGSTSHQLAQHAALPIVIVPAPRA